MAKPAEREASDQRSEFYRAFASREGGVLVQTSAALQDCPGSCLSEYALVAGVRDFLAQDCNFGPDLYYPYNDTWSAEPPLSGYISSMRFASPALSTPEVTPVLSTRLPLVLPPAASPDGSSSFELLVLFDVALDPLSASLRMFAAQSEALTCSALECSLKTRIEAMWYNTDFVVLVWEGALFRPLDAPDENCASPWLADSVPSDTLREAMTDVQLIPALLSPSFFANAKIEFQSRSIVESSLLLVPFSELAFNSSLLITLPLEYFARPQLQNSQVQLLVMTIFMLSVTILAASALFFYLQEKTVSKKQQELFLAGDAGDEDENLSANLEKHREATYGVVLTAFRNSWDRMRVLSPVSELPALKGVNNQHAQLPLDLSAMHQHICNRAVQHIRESHQGKNILTACILESLPSPIPLRLFTVRHSLPARIFLQVVVFTHMLLGFWEPFNQERSSSLFDVGPAPLWLVAAEAACLSAEVLFIALDLSVNWVWKAQNSLDAPNLTQVQFTQAGLWFLILVDLISSLFTGFRLENILPLRVVFYCLMDVSVRQSVHMVMTSILRSLNIMIVLFVVVLVAGVLGVVLFRNLVNAGLVANGFDNIQQACLSMFVYIISGENYVQIVWPALSVSINYIWFFLFFLIIGMFFVSAIVIGTFEDTFTELNLKELKKRLMFKRSGATLAFNLIDEDGDKNIGEAEFCDFICRCRPDLNKSEALRIFADLDTNKDKVGISLAEFVVGVETILMIVSEPPPIHTYLSPWRVWLRAKVLGPHRFECDENGNRSVARDRFDTLSLLLVLLSTTCACLFGSENNASQWSTTHSIGLTAAGCSFVDLLLRLAIYGWDEYINYAKYHLREKRAHAQAFANQVDAVVCFSVAFVAIFAWIETADPNRRRLEELAIALPVLRLLVLITRCRMTLHSVLAVLPTFIALFKLLFAINLVFAVYGHLAFRNEVTFTVRKILFLFVI